tara:strand:- start:275 stop:604 length:330 start_codon:yes stop_codon:yes gene_type:complete
MKNFLFLLTLLILYCQFSFSKIEDPRVWDNIYNGCITSAKLNNNDLSSPEILTYCKCAANQMTDKFSVKELLLFEVELYTLSKEDRNRVALLNEKIKNIYVDCMSKIIK